MQQLSGSSGLGGTRIPAILVDARSSSLRRSAGPASREPKTMRALAMLSSFWDREWEEAELGGAVNAAVGEEVSGLVLHRRSV